MAETENRKMLMDELRNDIITELNRHQGKAAFDISEKYLLQSFCGEEGTRDFIKCISDKDCWAGAWFYLDLKRKNILAEVATYPNALGASKSDFKQLTPGEFGEIVQKFNFRKKA